MIFLMIFSSDKFFTPNSKGMVLWVLGLDTSLSMQSLCNMFFF